MGVTPPINYKMSLKRVIVNALRSVYHDTTFPSQLLQETQITIEYPMTPEQYPSMIVGFQEQQLKSAGINHTVTVENSVYTEWIFDGIFTIEIFALTSLDRDYISDYVVDLLSFGRVKGYPFREYVEGLGHNANVVLNVGSLTPQGENTLDGSSWGLTDTRVYTTGYSFPCFGQFASPVHYYDLISQVDGFTDQSNTDSPQSAWTNPISFTSGG